MRQWKIINDQLLDAGVEVQRLGISKSMGQSAFKELDRNTEFVFPFTQTSHSLGDWGILSRLPECIKQLYPNVKFYTPSSLLIKDIFNFRFNQNNWTSTTDAPWFNNEIIFKHNPYIDGTYAHGELSGECYTDHYRIYSEEIINEPLVEQLLRAFGATEDEIATLNTSPKLYISPEEEEWYQKFINQHFGDEYGCLLLSHSKKELNHRWEFDHHLINQAEQYKNYPVFYYSSFDINDTEWGQIFPNYISFSELKLTIRQQMIVKQKSIFNIGYQAGVTDAIAGGGSDVITLTPYENLKHNTIRGVKYVFSNGTEQIF